ncbi:MAG: DUF2844 domain-containing protein, partial [Terriglobales bacterium]
HEFRAADGGVVRAFVNPSGEVFGLAWETPTVPDMAQLLGTRFAAFQQAAARSQRRGPLYVHVQGMVVEMSGHMRDFRGRAYLAAAIPAPLTPAVVR